MPDHVQTDQHIGGPRDGQPVRGNATYSQSSCGQDQPGLYVTYARIDGRFVFRGYLSWAEGRPPEPPKDPVTPDDSAALKRRSEHYPASYGDRVPKRVRLLCRVRPDCAWAFYSAKEIGNVCRAAGEEHPVYVNSHGAVSLILSDYTQLGVRPDEFEVIEWHELPEVAHA